MSVSKHYFADDTLDPVIVRKRRYLATNFCVFSASFCVVLLCVFTF